MGVATLPREERVMPMQYQERGSYEHAVSEMEGYDESARGGGLKQRSSGGGRGQPRNKNMEKGEGASRERERALCRVAGEIFSRLFRCCCGMAGSTAP